MKPSYAAIAAPTSAPCPDASCKPCAARGPTIRCSCSTRSTSSARTSAATRREVLDPAQNAPFRDNYLDLPFDLSKVFFITTANTLDTIPRPLLDRLEILQLSGYSEEEKVEIAKRYIVPRQLAQVGLTALQLIIPDETLSQLISRYTREAGVRQKEKAIGRVARKVAMRFAEGAKDLVTVLPK